MRGTDTDPRDFVMVLLAFTMDAGMVMVKIVGFYTILRLLFADTVF
jgi:hypothetical protein